MKFTTVYTNPKKFSTVTSAFRAWMARSYFVLPDNGVTLMVGETITIYGDELINAPNGTDYIITYTCNIGNQSGNDYNISPVTGDIGIHAFRILITDSSYTIVDETINLTIQAKETTGHYRILAIGDSTLGAEYLINAGLTDLTGLSLEWIGSQAIVVGGVTYGHEGRPGYQWGEYSGDIINTNVSPFVKTGVIDIPAYFADNHIETPPDIVYFRLGINGLSADSSDEIIYSKKLIDAFLAYALHTRIIIGIPNKSNNYNTGYETVNSNIHKLWQLFIATYANGTYNSRVDVSYEIINLNRTNGYTNDLHPNATGYGQIAQGLGAYLNKAIKTFTYGAELMPDVSVWAASGLAWWDLITDPTFVGDGTKITINGSGFTYIAKSTFWAISKVYRIIITGVVSSSYARLYDLSDYTGSSVIVATQTYSCSYKPSQTSMAIGSWTFIGEISAISIKEIL